MYVASLFPGPGLETVLERQQTTNTELQENLFILTQLLRNLLTFVLTEEQPEDREDETQDTLSTANTLINDDKKETIRRQPGLGGFMAVLSSTFKTTVEKVVTARRRLLADEVVGFDKWWF